MAPGRGGGFVVGEIGARLHAYAPGDRHLNTLGQLPSSKMVGLDPIGSDTTFLVSGNHAAGGRQFGAFIWSPSRGARDPVHPVARRFEEPYRSNLWNVRAVVAGDYYVSLDQSANRLTRISQCAVERRTFLVGANPTQQTVVPAGSGQSGSWR